VLEFPIQDLREWSVAHQEDREDAAQELELSFEQWVKVHDALADRLDTPRALHHPKKSVFPLKFKSFAGTVHVESAFFRPEVWGTSSAAWLALQCAAGHHEKCGFPKDYTFAKLIGERHSSQHGDIGQLFDASEIVDLSNFRTPIFLNYILTSPAKVGIFNSPWNIQTKLVICVALLLEGVFEVVVTAYSGRPAMWHFYTDRDWWYLTFRVELLGAFIYLLSRLFIIAFSILRISGVHRRATVLGGYETVYFMTVLMILFPLCGALVLGPHFLPAVSLLVACVLPFLAASLSCLHHIGGMIEKCRVRPWMKTLLRRMGVCALFVVLVSLVAGSMVVISHQMKRWLSSDTCLCNFSKQVLFDSHFNVKSIGGFLAVAIAFTFFVFALLSLGAFFAFIVSSVATPGLLHRLWLWRCALLVGIMKIDTPFPIQAVLDRKSRDEGRPLLAESPSHASLPRRTEGGGA